jgi:hypothetical protein
MAHLSIVLQDFLGMLDPRMVSLMRYVAESILLGGSLTDFSFKFHVGVHSTALTTRVRMEKQYQLAGQPNMKIFRG